MPADSSRAVFLSYASQDAEAARRICEALRAAGVEVWFDQSELRGGDAWDAKIRKQIKECALFVPVISANTQARREGYFRIEWKLAAQRTHAIAEGTPFLLPVVIDDTPEAEALVPGEFREVQWTSLAGSSGHPPEAGIATFCARVRGLLFDELGAPVSSAAPVGTVGVRPARESLRRWRIPAVILVALVTGLLIWRPWQRFSSSGQRVGSPASQIVDQAYALTQKVTVTRDDLDAADTLAQRALEREPESPRVWAVRAWIQAAYLERRLDFTRKRRDDAHSLAKRALVLNPDDADALNALARVMLEQESWSEAEKLAARAVQLAPDNQRSRLLQAAALTGQDRRPEARAMLEEAVRRRPTDVLARCELAENYAPVWRPGEPTTAQVATALEHLDTAIAQQPCEPALVAKAILAGSRLGDLAKMREALDALDKLPLAERTTDRAIYAAMWCGLLERNLPRVLAAAALTTRSFLSDTMVHLPKEHYVAMAYRMAGKEALAQQQWRIAEETMREQMRDHPTDGREPMRLALILASAGKREEAAREIGPTAAAWNEAMTPGHARNLAGYFAATGDAEKAAPWIDRALNAQTYLTDHTLLLEPRWDGLRGHPAFEKVAEKARQRIARSNESRSSAHRVEVATADPKSVVVLPFANLSGDPAQEYFSDGVTEEILNALMRERDLRVVPRSSAFSFKENKRTTAEIARMLGVAQVVEGSVRRAGNQVRIDCTITRMSDNTTQALPRFAGEMKEAKDIFTLQDAVASAVLERIAQRKAIVAAPVQSSNLAAYETYLRGRALQMKGAAAQEQQAADCYEEAVRLDPQYSLAWARLAQSLLRQATRNFDRSSASLQRARRAVAEALQLRPELPEAHLVCGQLRLYFDRDPDAADRELNEVERLRPNDPEATLLRAEVLRIRGRWNDDLVRLALRAAELDLNNADTLTRAGDILSEAGRFADADRLFVLAWGASKVSVVPLRQRSANVLAWTGDVSAALAELEAFDGDRATLFHSARGRLHALIGNEELALADSEKARALTGPGDGAGALSVNFSALRQMALIEQKRGHLAQARELFERAVEVGRKYRTLYPEVASFSLAEILARAGALVEARKELQESSGQLRDGVEKEALRAQAKALVALGEHDAAIENLVALAASGRVFGYWLRVDPDWQPLMKYPRFQKLMAEQEARAGNVARPKK